MLGGCYVWWSRRVPNLRMRLYRNGECPWGRNGDRKEYLYGKRSCAPDMQCAHRPDLLRDRAQRADRIGGVWND
jgi:hypothetical protein